MRHTFTHRNLETGFVSQENIEAESLSSAMKEICHVGFDVFHSHPRKPIWVRRSKCNRYQQTLEQHRKRKLS